MSRFELDTMCKQFEKEDILQVYMPAGKSASSLSEEQAQEILAQADSRLKVFLIQSKLSLVASGDTCE